MAEPWDLDEAELRAVRDARLKANESLNRTDDTVQRLERLALLCQAMWEMLRERVEFSDDQLAAKVREVDLRDGREDGRRGERVLECPHCRNSVNSQSPRCVVCGQVVVAPHPFEI